MRAKDFMEIQEAVKAAREAVLSAIPVDYADSPTRAKSQRNCINADFDRLARDLASTLERQNPRFDRIRFLTGCGALKP